MPKIFGREPAVIAALVATVLQYVNTVWLHWSDHQTAVINAAVAVVLGAVAAALVSVDKALPLLAGVTQAIIDVALAFGAHWSQGSILAFMAVVNGVLTFFGVRPQVTASVAADGRRVPTRRLNP
jgi:hypothetical protein